MLLLSLCGFKVEGVFGATASWGDEDSGCTRKLPLYHTLKSTIVIFNLNLEYVNQLKSLNNFGVSE